MKIANISYTKNHLSELLDRVKEGESILIVDRKTPVARLEPMTRRGESADEPAWIETQVRSGAISRPSKAVQSEQIVGRKLPKPKAGGDVLRALLRDREEGR